MSGDFAIFTVYKNTWMSLNQSNTINVTFFLLSRNNVIWMVEYLSENRKKKKLLCFFFLPRCDVTQNSSNISIIDKAFWAFKLLKNDSVRTLNNAWYRSATLSRQQSYVDTRSQFRQSFMSSFYSHKSQKRKIDWQLDLFFFAFGICAHKSCS